MAVFKSSPVSTGLERAGRQQGGHGQKTQSTERPRSSLEWRIRITGFGRTGQVTHWYMGGILTKNQEQKISGRLSLHHYTNTSLYLGDSGAISVFVHRQVVTPTPRRYVAPKSGNNQIQGRYERKCV